MKRALARGGPASRGLRSSVLVAIALGACQSPEGREPVQRPALGGEIVAIVGDRAITRHELRDEMRHTGASARAALDRLEADALLALEARRRDLAAGRSGATIRRRALVQALLATVEQTHPPDAIPEADVVAEFERRRSRELAGTELRTVLDLVVRPDPLAGEDADRRARTLAEEALARAATEPGERSLRAVARAAREHAGLGAGLSRLQSVTRASGLDPDVLRAVFGAPSSGPVSAPVRTADGWHAIVVESIEDGSVVQLGELEDTIRADLLNQRRADAVETLIADVAARVPVELRQATLRRALADDSLFQRVR